ncbi:hypothetical protein E2562_019369 [Oryza meyeriana var. granulata]|uniref:Uncharacterized protein n=1 Tax=Oryza meyeriana var. granulata TaxID=110450 RepID=A0A6G1BLE0_9ORYZ|nr:hypothetical protein E2562_019369 [Oryza meyeriana var. granulata]
MVAFNQGTLQSNVIAASLWPPAYSAPAEIASFLQVAAALLLPLLLLLERQPICGEPRLQLRNFKEEKIKT